MFQAGKSAVAPASTKTTVYRRSDGAAVTVWPVDARELVASGEYSRTPPGAAGAPLGASEGTPQGGASSTAPAADPAGAASATSGASNATAQGAEPAAVPPGDGPPVTFPALDAKAAQLLEQAAPVLIPLLDQVTDRGLLDAIERIERAGKQRKTVLEAIRAKQAALPPATA